MSWMNQGIDYFNVKFEPVVLEDMLVCLLIQSWIDYDTYNMFLLVGIWTILELAHASIIG
jgi:hypothetical protein